MERPGPGLPQRRPDLDGLELGEGSRSEMRPIVKFPRSQPAVSGPSAPPSGEGTSHRGIQLVLLNWVAFWGAAP